MVGLLTMPNSSLNSAKVRRLSFFVSATNDVDIRRVALSLAIMYCGGAFVLAQFDRGNRIAYDKSVHRCRLYQLCQLRFRVLLK